MNVHVIFFRSFTLIMSHVISNNIVDGNASDDEYITDEDDQTFSDSQYFVTFKRNKHNETIIDHMIDNDDMDEDLFVLEEEQDGTTDSEYEPSSETTHKRNKKNRVGGWEGKKKR